jgi:ABC-type transport system substrate-binding protein
MLSGTLDVLSSPGGIDRMMLPQFDGSDRTELITRNTVLFYYLQFKCNPSTTFGDENVRKAFSLAIDRQMLVDGIFGGEAYVNDGGFFGPGVDGYEKGLLDDYNPDEAKRLLDASAYNGEVLQLVTTQSMPKAEEFALAVADMAKAVGFNMEVHTDEPGVYAEKRFGGNYDMYVGYTSLNNAPGGNRRHFNQITTDMYLSEMALNPNIDYAHLQELIATYYAAASNKIAYDAAAEYNRYTFEHTAPQTAILFLKATNAQAKGITGMRWTEAGIQYFKYIDWIQ